MSSPIETLELLSIFSNRLSHSMRTPLGVCIGIVEDLLKGFQLSPAELEDGKRSLRQLVEILDGLKEISSRARFEPKAIEPSLLIESEVRPHLGASITLLSRSPTLPAFSGDTQLLGRALRLSAGYLLTKQKKRELQGGKVAIQIVLTEAGRQGNSCDLCFVLSSGEAAAEVSSVAESRSVGGLLSEDHSLEALGLIIAEQVMLAHGGFVSVSGRTAEKISIRLGVQCSRSNCSS